MSIVCVSEDEPMQNALTLSDVTDNSVVYHMRYVDLNDREHDIYFEKSEILRFWNLNETQAHGQMALRRAIDANGRTFDFRPIMALNGATYYIDNTHGSSLWMKMLEDVHNEQLPHVTVIMHM